MKFLNHKISLPIYIILALLFLYACSKKSNKVEPTDEQSLSRKEVLTNIADEIVIPAYAQFKIKLDVMISKSNTFTSNPNQVSLTEFRNAWMDAYTEWQKVELFDFGPAQTQAIRLYFNIYPANEAGINSNIANVATVNLEFGSTIASQGFPALDYLLNGLDNSDANILVFYTTAIDADKRISYVKKLVERMNTLFSKVNNDWTTYRAQFISRTGTDAGSSLAVIVNSYVLNYERYIRSGKFGIPSGAMMNGVISADKVEALYKKDISLTLAKTAQQASIDFFNGKSVKTGSEGPSFKTYLDALGAKDKVSGTLLSKIINDQFIATNAKLGLLGNDLNSEVKNNNQKMIDVYLQMQKSVALLKVDMTSAMSIGITYTDNDGD